MSIALATRLRTQDLERHKVSVLDTELLFATRVGDLVSLNVGRTIHDLLESSSHGRAEVVHNSAAFKKNWSSVREKRRDERPERALHMRLRPGT